MESDQLKLQGIVGKRYKPGDFMLPKKSQSETEKQGELFRIELVGLHYLKHTYGLSDEETVHNWTENPYWQYFCGSKWFEHKLPIDPSSMTRWRKKIGEAGVEEMLEGTIKAGLKGRVIKPMIIRAMRQCI